MQLDFSKPLIMGVLNVTPDSFSDGGQFVEVDEAVSHAKQMIIQGADIIDIGGESSRPGSDPVSVDEELQRVIPVIEKLLELSIPISIDTYKPEVAQECLSRGVHILNDIEGLRNQDMVTVAAKYDVPVIVMHMLGKPKTMQHNIEYSDVIEDIYTFFEKQIAIAKGAGISELILDPGIGFGKTVDHNLQIIKNLDGFKSLGYPLLVGASRKSFIGKLTGANVQDRLSGTIVSNIFALQNGASILRVHDVKECKQAIQLFEAISNA